LGDSILILIIMNDNIDTYTVEETLRIMELESVPNEQRSRIADVIGALKRRIGALESIIKKSEEDECMFNPRLFPAI